MFTDNTHLYVRNFALGKQDRYYFQTAVSAVVLNKQSQLQLESGTVMVQKAQGLLKGYRQIKSKTKFYYSEYKHISKMVKFALNIDFLNETLDVTNDQICKVIINAYICMQKHSVLIIDLQK